jgi:hypothetical protein
MKCSTRRVRLIDNYERAQEINGIGLNPQLFAPTYYLRSPDLPSLPTLSICMGWYSRPGTAAAALAAAADPYFG